MQSTAPLLAAKPHYEILDGLRGVAALIIVVYHLFEGCGIALGHGYLGVDFFYALSGFVIAYAYDDRWGRMGTGTFFKRRLVRLHPMVVMGTLLGLLFYYFGQSAAFPYIGTHSVGMVLGMFVFCCLMLPMPNAWDLRGWQDFNSFNGNIWSLTWEYVANIAYALFLRFLPTAVLGLLTVAAALGTLDVTFNLDLFGVFSESRVGKPFTVNGGWSLTPAELYIGLVRVAYPFMAGMMLARLKGLLRLRGAFVWCSLAVAAIFLMPSFSGVWNGAFEAATILFFIPLVVSLGAGSSLKGEGTRKVCNFLGDISYPLYITHMPFVYMQIAWLSNHPEATLPETVLLCVSLLFLSVGTAYACLKLYDLPVRKWLAKRWL